MNDESEWIITEVPHLRIISQELWDKTKARQKELDRQMPELCYSRRPQYLLSKKEDLEKVTARSSELEALLKASSTKPKPFLHPAMAQSYPNNPPYAD